MKSRKERRQEARNNKTPFEPQYNGEGVISHQEYLKRNKKLKATEEDSKNSSETLAE